MEPLEIVEYWRNALCEGGYGKGEGNRKMSAGDQDELACIKVDCSESIRKVEAYTEKERLQEFICLYALYFTLHQMTGASKIGLMVRCGPGYFPLIYQLDGQKGVKDEIQQLYSAYKMLFAVSQSTNARLVKYLHPREQQCVDGIGHIYFSWGSPLPGREAFVINGGQVELSYRRGRADGCFMDTLLGSYDNVLRQVIDRLSGQGGAGPLSLLNAKDQQRILSWSAGEVRSYPREDAPYQLFRHWVDRQPDRVAVVCGEKSQTYRELDHEVRKIGHQMLDRQIQTGDRVALLCEQSCRTVAAVLAIWAVGAVYVPVSPQLTNKKVQSMLELAGANLLLLPQGVLADLDMPVERLVLDGKGHRECGELPHVSGGDLHMIFTSGTTGRPKAVVIQKEGFLNLCQWYGREYKFDEQARSLLLTSYSFDASVKNLFVPLMTGGQLYLPQAGLYNIEGINQLIDERKITHINCVPSLLNHMLELEEKSGYQRLESLQAVILGGEKFSVDRLRDWMEASGKQRMISNVYGPTEGTDLSTYYHVMKEDLNGDVPIGRPLDNKRVYILDEQLELCPCYKTGMVHLAGVGVIRGYLGGDAQRDKFVKSPSAEGETLYATGDLARWNADGEIEYVGRIDNQVKVNGQRIELEEIENIALLSSAVKQSGAIVKPAGDASRELIVFYSPKTKNRVEQDALKKLYADCLPASLQPNRLIEIDSFPVNSNGKIDREALIYMVSSTEGSGRKDVKPRTRLEQQILEIWRKILKKESISIDTPFFEAGGNSLLLNTLKLELTKLKNCGIKLTDFFEYPTIEMLAQYIEQR